MLQHLTIVATGGTIDKIYFDDKSTFQIGAPQIGEILTQLGVAFPFDVIALMRKDSLHLNESDRDLIRRTIQAQPHRHVMVTHGTDTMVETGLYLKRGIANPEVPIVLTGSMTPLGFEESDALQNLTEALFATRLLDPGVWIVMHNQVFPIDRVRKDRELARFVPLTPASNPAANS